MPTILDIAGKPIRPRNQTRRKLRAQDVRDLVKIFVMLVLVAIGYYLFAPTRDAAQEIRIAAQQKAIG
jgi:hypothetical protein